MIHPQSILRSWKPFSAIAGSALLGIIASAASALALTPEQIAKKLEVVPVFVFYNVQTQQFPLSATTVAGKQVPILRTFMDQTEAEQILQQVRGKNPNFTGVEVRPMPLSLIYLEAQAKDRKPDSPQFQVIPDDIAIKAAVDTLKAEGRDIKNVTGLPLFFAPEIGWVKAVGNAKPEQVLPMYFSETDIKAAIAEAKKREPKLASVPIKVQVTTLEKVVSVMADQKDPKFAQVEFVPPLSSLTYIEKLQKAAPPVRPGGANPGQPGARPAQPRR